MVTNHGPANFILTALGEVGHGPSFAFSRTVRGLRYCLLQCQWLPGSLACGLVFQVQSQRALRPFSACNLLRLHLSPPFSTFNSPRDYSRITWVSQSDGPGFKSVSAEFLCNCNLSSPCPWQFSYSQGVLLWSSGRSGTLLSQLGIQA